MGSNRLKYWRKKRQLSMRMLSEKAQVNRNTIVSLEKGNNAYPSTWQKLAKALEVSVEELTEEEAPSLCA